ncbi:MAG TPA: hypothetical protein VJ870_18495 [Amycolatopsis sp.]|nr:hypothetical protein [Amycolatopsis sp.]
MSLFEALRQRGTVALLGLAGAVAVFLLLHLIRMPLVLLARVLETSMRRIDAFAVRQASQPPRRAINQFFHPDNGFRGEAPNVHA